MCLTSLTIGQYKNLRDFFLSLDGGSFIETEVGWNSGKLTIDGMSKKPSARRCFRTMCRPFTHPVIIC